MDAERRARILSLAALYDFAWVVLLRAWPRRVLLKPPPRFQGLIAGIGLLGPAFAVGGLPVLNDLVRLPFLVYVWKQECRS